MLSFLQVKYAQHQWFFGETDPVTLNTRLNWLLDGVLLLVQSIAEESQSESKWKQLGELAMSAGKV